MDNQDFEKITITLEDGTKKEAELIVQFEVASETYVIYELDNKAFAARKEDNNELRPISDDEWPLIEKIYEEFMSSEDNIDKTTEENEQIH